ncbi:Thymidylate synthase, partial [Frankia sp. CpI1-P]
DHKLFHAVTSIAEPSADDSAVRSRVNGLLHDKGMAPIETVANTIFPYRMAATAASPAVLVDRYRKAYPTIRRFVPNRWGTYFGRIVSYPSDAGPVDQLGETIRRLNEERRGGRPKSARYELSVMEPSDISRPLPADEEPEGGTCEIPVAIRQVSDKNPMAFPCLSHCSFQLDGDTLHAVAHYRSQYLVQRAYGNYLGLGRLLEYVARQVDAQPGHLLVVAGYAQLDGAAIRRVRQLLADLNQPAKTSATSTEVST